MKPAVMPAALPTPPVDYEIPAPPAATSSRRLMAMIGLVVCLTFAALYLVVCSADQPVARAVTSQAEPVPPQVQAPDIQAMVVRLAARLQKEPGNGPGWQILARSYAALGRFADAAAAYRTAAALLPADANLLADYADVLAMSQSGSFRGEPTRLIRKALEIDPQNPRALTLAGDEAFRRDDLREALGYWNKGLEFVSADSALAVSVRGGIAEANKRLEGTAGNPGR